MSESKYKIGDRFLDEQNNEIEIIENQGGSLPYVLNGGRIVNDTRLDGLKKLIRLRPKPMFEGEFKKITSSICKMVEEKNKRYGESALQPLDIFNKHHNYGSRLDEKLARVKNSDELRKNDVADIIGGLILICKDKGWNNFDDQID